MIVFLVGGIPSGDGQRVSLPSGFVSAGTNEERIVGGHQGGRQTEGAHDCELVQHG
jgi:hypothetical protein